MADVDSIRPIDGESRRENPMEPSSAAIVIVAIGTPIQVGITKWVAELLMKTIGSLNFKSKFSASRT